MNCLSAERAHPGRLVDVAHLADAVGAATHHLVQRVVRARAAGRTERLQQVGEDAVGLRREPAGDPLLAAELAAVEQELVVVDHLTAAQGGEHLVGLRVVLRDRQPGEARLHVRAADDVVHGVEHGLVLVVRDEPDDDLHVHEERAQLVHLLDA